MDDPLISVLFVVNVGAVVAVFPTVGLSVIENRSFTGTSSFPGTDNVAAIIFIDPYKSKDFLGFYSLFTVADMGNSKVGGKLIIRSLNSFELLTFVFTDRIAALDLGMLLPGTVDGIGIVICLLRFKDALKSLQGTLLILKLASLFRTSYNNARRLVSNPYASLNLINMLTAFASAMHSCYLTVFRIKFSDFFSLLDHMYIHVPVLTLMAGSYSTLPYPKNCSFKMRNIFVELHNGRLAAVT